MAFDQESNDVLKNHFWSYEFTSESLFKWKFALKSWFKQKKGENYKLKTNYIKNKTIYDKNYKIWWHWNWRIQISSK